MATSAPPVERRLVGAKANADLSKMETDEPCVAPTPEMDPVSAALSKIATPGRTAEPSRIAREVNVALFEIPIFGPCAGRRPAADRLSAVSLRVVICARCVAHSSDLLRG